MTALPYRTLSTALRERFHTRVRKITLDAGLTCPHRDSDRKGGCIYCNARGSGTGALARGMSLKEQIENQILVMKRRYGAEAFIAYFQSYSNTYAAPDVLKSIYDHILPYPGIK
ncbi:MAG TPA: TIGR01212 family radical SAM protein, partial [Desulfomonilia bacterium]|nr:TIGR01212 family radical SAM protein [Desulfomonilia bacterium]